VRISGQKLSNRIYINERNVARYLVNMRVFGSMRRENRFSLFVDGMYGHSDWK
jgi:hypothetical protein